MPWIHVNTELPDSDLSVMTYAPDSSMPIWPGYHDGERWMDLNGIPMQLPVTHWTNFPEPPVKET